MDKRRKVIVSNETVDNDGVRTHIRRHLICKIKEISSQDILALPTPHLYILKERDTKQQTERFLFRLKGSICTMCNNRTFLITFLHSLKIDVKVLAEEALEI